MLLSICTYFMQPWTLSPISHYVKAECREKAFHEGFLHREAKRWSWLCCNPAFVMLQLADVEQKFTILATMVQCFPLRCDFFVWSAHWGITKSMSVACFSLIVDTRKYASLLFFRILLFGLLYFCGQCIFSVIFGQTHDIFIDPVWSGLMALNCKSR